MFIEEKIDNLCRHFSTKDLVIRYTDYKVVMTKIENKFLLNINPNFKFCEWSERLNDFTINTYEKNTYDLLTDKLLADVKYWWIFVDEPCCVSSRHRLFGATLLAGKSLSYIFSESPIYIVHKKYDWMLMVDRKAKTLREKILL
jgi:hypothetical protein